MNGKIKAIKTSHESALHKIIVDRQ